MDSDAARIARKLYDHTPTARAAPRSGTSPAEILYDEANEPEADGGDDEDADEDGDEGD